MSSLINCHGSLLYCKITFDNSTDSVPFAYHLTSTNSRPTLDDIFATCAIKSPLPFAGPAALVWLSIFYHTHLYSKLVSDSKHTSTLLFSLPSTLYFLALDKCILCVSFDYKSHFLELFCKILAMTDFFIICSLYLGFCRTQQLRVPLVHLSSTQCSDCACNNSHS